MGKCSGDVLIWNRESLHQARGLGLPHIGASDFKQSRARFLSCMYNSRFKDGWVAVPFFLRQGNVFEVSEPKRLYVPPAGA